MHAGYNRAPISQRSLPALAVSSAMLFLLGLLMHRSGCFFSNFTRESTKTRAKYSDDAQKTILTFPTEMKRLHINIGPNTSPLGLSLKEEDKDLGVLLVEANLGIANMLRETRQKKHPGRIFVINCAVAGAPLAGSFHSFHSFNKDGLSSSLAQPARSKMGDLPSWATGPAVNITYGPGAGGVDFVPVLSLDSLLDAIPNRIEISFLKTDTQGFDFKVVQSAKRTKLRRIKMLMTETYMDKALYVDVQNDLETDWIPHMRKMGFSLDNPPSAKKTEHDAIWSRID